MQDLPLEEVYFFLMERIQRRAKEITKREFQIHEIDLTVDQWILVKRIAEGEGISQKDLAQSTFKEPAAVTRMLDLLIKKAVVKKEASAKDRRRYELYLTEQGEAIYKRGLPIAVNLRAHGLQGIEATELEKLKDILNRIYDNLGS